MISSDARSIGSTLPAGRGWRAAIIACSCLLATGLAARADSLAPLAPDFGVTELRAVAPNSGYAPGTHLRTDRPHPAVARIIVPEGEATSLGSGTLIDVRDQFGLVVTNWHVVRDGTGDVEVVFPDGFRSKARPLKVDQDWDLAALVIWRPPFPPVTMSATAPRPGDQLTICGYGQGQYRTATGRCTQYYAPKANLPEHMVELNVEARQGDSGGPIFNEHGELAGVLFGAGGGTTLGSFGGRVGSFLATLAPDIGRASDSALVQAQAPAVRATPNLLAGDVVSQAGAQGRLAKPAALGGQEPEQASHIWTPVGHAREPADGAQWQAVSPPSVGAGSNPGNGDFKRDVWFDQAKSVLAVVGLLALALQAMRVVR